MKIDEMNFDDLQYGMERWLYYRHLAEVSEQLVSETRGKLEDMLATEPTSAEVATLIEHLIGEAETMGRYKEVSNFFADAIFGDADGVIGFKPNEED